jgi:hypothetical protein
VALAAAFFLAVSPWHLFLSQNARYYTPLIFFFTLSFFAFYFSLEQNNLRLLAVSIMAMGLAVLERVHALFFAPVIVLYLLWLLLLPFEKPAGLNRKNLVLFSVLPAALYLLYELYNVVIQGNPSFLSIFLSPQFLGQTTSRPRWLLTGLITDVGVPLSVLAASGAFFLLREKRRIGLLLCLAASVPILALMAMAPFFQTFNQYAIISLPAWITLGAVGLVRLYERAAQRGWVLLLGGVIAIIFLLFLRDRVVQDLVFYFRPQVEWLLLLGLGLLSAILAVTRLPVRKCPGDWAWIFGILLVSAAHPLAADSLYYRTQHAYRDNLWRWAMQVVRQEKAPGDWVVSAMPPVASYYLDEKVQDLQEVDLVRLLEEGERVWLIDEFGVYRMKGAAFSGWIEANCALRGEQERFLRGERVFTRVRLCSR